MRRNDIGFDLQIYGRERGRKAAFESQLQSGFRIQLVGLGWIVAYLAAFNLLAIPLNFWLCRRMGRPEWRWWTLIVIALAFAWYGFKTGTEGKQQFFQINELTLLTRPSLTELARAQTFTTFFSPRQISRDLRTEALTLPVFEKEIEDPRQARMGNPFGQRGRPARAARTLPMEFTPGSRLGNWGLFPWTPTHAHIEYTEALEGRVELRDVLEDGQGRLTGGTLVNGTGLDFERYWLRARGGST